jgi:hypothetical protein
MTWYLVLLSLYMIYWGVGDMIFLMKDSLETESHTPTFRPKGPPSVSDQDEGRPAGLNLDRPIDPFAKDPENEDK